MQPNPELPTRPQPVDLEIHVTTPWARHSGGRSFEFTLTSPSGVAGFYREQIAGKSFTSEDAKVFQRHIFDQLEELARGKDVDHQPLLREEMAEDLVALGQELYQQLIPRELQTIYREIGHRIGTLLLVSDEPWIPWEMVHPTDPGDTFLCLRHVFARWLAGSHSPGASTRVQRLLSLRGADEERLQQAAAERQFLDEFCADISGLNRVESQATRALELVADLLEEPFDLLHFAGHGEHDTRQPGEAKIFLVDGAFRARQLTADVQRKLQTQRPLIVFNSCQVGQLSQSFTELGGWAHQWIRRCGCSSFLAPAWSVADGRSSRFAEVFYQSLQKGRPLGEALLEARRTLFAEDPGEPTWLAYRLYGSPTARVTFGDSEPEQDLEPLLPLSKPTFETTSHEGTAVLRHREPAKSRSTQPAPAATHSRPNQRPKAFTPRDQRPAWKSRPVQAMLILFILALAATLGLSLLENPLTSPPQGSEVTSGTDGSDQQAPPEDDKKPTDKKVLDRGGQAAQPQEALSQPPPPAPPDTKPEPEQATSSFPYQTLVPDKIVIIAVDEEDNLPDPELASAFRTLIRSLLPKYTVLVPTLPADEALRLTQGLYPSSRSDSLVPWGAEYFLVISGTTKPLEAAAPHLTYLNLNLTLDLIKTQQQASVVFAQQNHNGKDVSTQGAMFQAAERCLKPIISHLNQGGD